MIFWKAGLIIVDNEYLLDETEFTSHKTVPPEAYTEEYYITCCDGYEEFNDSQGKDLPRRLSEPLKLLQAKPRSMILDIGCGRGELIYHLAQQGHQAIGLDYAAPGVKIAKDTLHSFVDGEIKANLALFLSNAKHLSFSNESIDHVFMLDVVEHLFPFELEIAFREIYRVLKPGGNLIVHTMPNTWYYTIGYPTYRFVQWLRGVQLPANPRARWHYSDVHVNEQNPIRLYQALRKAKFVPKVWLKSIQDYSYEQNILVRTGMDFLTSAYPFKLIYCNDIFAIAAKPKT